MGRLIDADALIEKMKKTEEDYEKAMTSPGWYSAYVVIKNQPTAYDVEKVKKEIDRVGKSFCDYVACNEECTSCEHHSIMNAVTSIVRKGGV